MKKNAVILLIMLLFFGLQMNSYYKKMTPLYTIVEEIPEEKSIVYFYLNGCSACSSYKVKTTEFIETYEIPIYAINIEDYDKKKLDLLDINEVPSTLFMNEKGVVIRKTIGVMEVKEIWENYETIK